jgi:ABC-2 type transport system ATP-binding protein
MEIKIENIYKEYKNFKLDIPVLQMANNSIIGLVGKNGAGKTTLLKILYSLVYSKNMKITIDDKTYKSDSREWKSKIFFSPETNIFPEAFKAKDIANYYKHFYSEWNSSDFYSCLDLFHIPDKKVKELSLGNKKKLSLSAAFASNSEITILDEPLSNVDPVERTEIKKYMKQYKDKNKCIIYSSHILSEVIDLCDYLIALKDGTCVLNCPNSYLTENELLELIK